MHPLVRDLLKRIVLLRQDHYDVNYMNKVAREKIAENKELTEEKDIRKAVAYGRWMLREEQGRVRFFRYRTLKKRYSNEPLVFTSTPFDEATEITNLNKDDS